MTRNRERAETQDDDENKKKGELSKMKAQSNDTQIGFTCICRTIRQIDFESMLKKWASIEACAKYSNCYYHLK